MSDYDLAGKILANTDGLKNEKMLEVMIKNTDGLLGKAHLLAQDDVIGLISIRKAMVKRLEHSTES